MRNRGATTPVINQHYDNVTGGNGDDIFFDTAFSTLSPVWINGSAINTTALTSHVAAFPDFINNFDLAKLKKGSFASGVYNGGGGTNVVVGDSGVTIVGSTTSRDSTGAGGMSPKVRYTTPVMFSTTEQAQPFPQYTVDMYKQLERPLAKGIQQYDTRVCNFIGNETLTPETPISALDDDPAAQEQATSIVVWVGIAVGVVVAVGLFAGAYFF